MPAKAKPALWIFAVYLFSFLCYLPMLLRQSGIILPDALLSAKYFFVLIPALISAAFLLCEHTAMACWFHSLKVVSVNEILICIMVALIGISTTCGYSLWRKSGLFRHAYPSVLSLLLAAAYLFAMALIEEMAWRGFLLNRIAAGRGKVSAAGLTGIIWAVWHIPMWSIRNSLAWDEVILLFVWAVLISFILGAVWFKFENLLSVSLLHMTFNICFLAPAQYNDAVIFMGITICYIFRKYKKGIKEF